MSFARAVMTEIRVLKKQLALLRGQANQRMVSGVVEEVKGDRVRVRLMDEGRDGKPVLSPWIRMAANTGHRGSGVSDFTRYGVGETVLVVSPNGRLGTMSAAMPWISTTNDPAPGAAENDGRVTTVGSARLEMRNGEYRLDVGGATIRARPNAINLVVGGSEIIVTAGAIKIKSPLVLVEGDQLFHNVKNVGDTHGHVTAPPGPPGPPV
jgi:phage baseplate assembly protein gpV